jgi:hypothetical protein
MPDHNPIQQGEPQRGPLNVDYRFLSLLLFCATRADLLHDYLASNNGRKPEARWAKLQELGLPHNVLAESHYLFALPETQKALQQLQLVTQTLFELNDYCSLSCPSFEILREIAWFNSKQTQPVPAAGRE